MYCPGYKDMPTGNDVSYCDLVHFPAKLCLHASGPLGL